MAGTSAKTRVIGIRVPVSMADEWELAAKVRGITVAAYALERAIRGGGQSSRSLTKLDALRADPTMKAVIDHGGELKPVAKVLPVTGTEFPARPVYLRGQAPAKGKGKP